MLPTFAARTVVLASGQVVLIGVPRMGIAGRTLVQSHVDTASWLAEVVLRTSVRSPRYPSRKLQGRAPHQRLGRHRTRCRKRQATSIRYWPDWKRWAGAVIVVAFVITPCRSAAFHAGVKLLPPRRHPPHRRDVHARHAGRYRRRRLRWPPRNRQHGRWRRCPVAVGVTVCFCSVGVAVRVAAESTVGSR